MEASFDLPSQARPDDRPVVLTIGNFDGVHRGHMALIDRARGIAAEMRGETVVVTFEPHPRCVLQPDRCPASLTTLDEKRDILARAGADRLVVVTFTRETAQWSAEHFCDLLVAGFNLRHLVIGHDFALGHQRRGDEAFLREYGGRHGFDVTVVEPVSDAGEPVSSSRVRAALSDGDITSAARLLGRPYFIDGAVEHGEQRGRTLGFPTANISITGTKCLPARGIYATWIRVDGRWHMAATNVGYRPTFGGDRLLVEAFILDFDADIYRSRVRLAFESRLRDEQTFESADALVHQMERDVEVGRSALRRSGPPTLLG